jgi:hypothetical protein
MMYSMKRIITLALAATVCLATLGCTTNNNYFDDGVDDPIEASSGTDDGPTSVGPGDSDTSDDGSTTHQPLEGGSTSGEPDNDDMSSDDGSTSDSSEGGSSDDTGGSTSGTDDGQSDETGMSGPQWTNTGPATWTLALGQGCSGETTGNFACEEGSQGFCLYVVHDDWTPPDGQSVRYLDVSGVTQGTMVQWGVQTFELGGATGCAYAPPQSAPVDVWCCL